MVLVDVEVGYPAFHAVAAYFSEAAEVVVDTGEACVSGCDVDAELCAVAFSWFDGGFRVVEVDPGVHLGMVFSAAEVSVWVEVFLFNFVGDCAEYFVVSDDVVPFAVGGYVADPVVVDPEAVSVWEVLDFLCFLVFEQYVVAFWPWLVFCDLS